jgi:hypothetical protein
VRARLRVEITYLRWSIRESRVGAVQQDNSVIWLVPLACNVSDPDGLARAFSLSSTAVVETKQMSWRRAYDEGVFQKIKLAAYTLDPATWTVAVFAACRHRYWIAPRYSSSTNTCSEWMGPTQRQQEGTMSTYPHSSVKKTPTGRCEPLLQPPA